MPPYWTAYTEKTTNVTYCLLFPQIKSFMNASQTWFRTLHLFFFDEYTTRPMY